jgi:hypothetical protein
MRASVRRNRSGDSCHRWYQPGSGRYSQPDPAGLFGGVNVFAYAASNPTAFIDPLGLATLNIHPPRFNPVPWADMPYCGIRLLNRLFNSPPFGCARANLTIDCDCVCADGGYRPSIDVQMRPEIFYANNLNYVPEELIRQEELRHTRNQEEYARQVFREATNFENLRFDSKAVCELACLGFEVRGGPGYEGEVHDTKPHPPVKF